jgi:hypothetical protein
LWHVRGNAKDLLVVNEQQPKALEKAQLVGPTTTDKCLPLARCDGEQINRDEISNPTPDDVGEEQAESHSWMPAKQPVWAFALNFFLPGAGLVYLGKPLAGMVNLIVVLALGTAIYFVLPRDVFERSAPWIGIAFQVSSGLWAQSIANAHWHAIDEERQTQADK